MITHIDGYVITILLVWLAYSIRLIVHLKAEVRYHKDVWYSINKIADHNEAGDVVIHVQPIEPVAPVAAKPKPKEEDRDSW